jgi:hypothetical protein
MLTSWGYNSGMARKRLAPFTCTDNIQMDHKYTRLNANGVLRYFVKKGHWYLTETDYCVWKKGKKKTSNKEKMDSFTLHFGLKYGITYQLDAIGYLFVYFQLDMFRAYTPIFRSNECCSFFTYAAYGVLGVVRCRSWGVCVLVACCTAEECVCWWRVATRHQHTHSSGPTPNYTKDTICRICKEIVTSIAPEDGRISPKHVELKEHK